MIILSIIKRINSLLDNPHSNIRTNKNGSYWVSGYSEPFRRFPGLVGKKYIIPSFIKAEGGIKHLSTRTLKVRETIKNRELAFMLKIIIQNPSSETVINNVYPDELDFWQDLLKDAVQGEIHVFDLESGQEVQVA